MPGVQHAEQHGSQCCSICWEPRARRDLSWVAQRCENGEHMVCLECFTNHVQRHLRSNGQFNAICCPAAQEGSQCEGKITREQIEAAENQLLSRESTHGRTGIESLLEQFDRVRDLQTHKTTQCPWCDHAVPLDSCCEPSAEPCGCSGARGSVCGGAAGDPSARGTDKACDAPRHCIEHVQVDCNACGKSFCRVHGCGHDPLDMSCTAFEAAEREAGDECLRGLKRQALQCPKCGIWVNRRAGCNHMTCRCGEEFCWECGEVIKGRVGGHYSGRSGGRCRQFRDSATPLLMKKHAWDGPTTPMPITGVLAHLMLVLGVIFHLSGQMAMAVGLLPAAALELLATGTRSEKRAGRSFLALELLGRASQLRVPSLLGALQGSQALQTVMKIKGLDLGRLFKQPGKTSPKSIGSLLLDQNLPLRREDGIVLRVQLGGLLLTAAFAAASLLRHGFSPVGGSSLAECGTSCWSHPLTLLYWAVRGVLGAVLRVLVSTATMGMVAGAWCALPLAGRSLLRLFAPAWSQPSRADESHAIGVAVCLSAGWALLSAFVANRWTGWLLGVAAGAVWQVAVLLLRALSAVHTVLVVVWPLGVMFVIALVFLGVLYADKWERVVGKLGRACQGVRWRRVMRQVGVWGVCLGCAGCVGFMGHSLSAIMTMGAGSCWGLVVLFSEAAIATAADPFVVPAGAALAVAALQ